MTDYPGFVPGLVITAFVALLASARVGRTMGIRRRRAAFLLLAIGLIMSATLTPGGGALLDATIQGCDTTGAALRFANLVPISDASLNVVLYIPLGVALASLSGGRVKVALTTTAILLPFAVEGLQLALPALGRRCETSDMVTNEAGFLVGVFAGTAFLALLRRRRRATAVADA